MTVTTNEMLIFLKAIHQKEKRKDVLAHEIGFSKEKFIEVFKEALNLGYVEGGHLDDEIGRDSKYILVFTNNMTLTNRGIENLNFYAEENQEVYEI